MSFDRRPHEFPIATLRSRAPGTRARALVGDLQRWLAMRWTWLRPRTLPVLVAAIGMVFVLASANYLAHAHLSPTPPAQAGALAVQLR